MEHREPPRMATVAEETSHDPAGDPVRGRRFPRFVTPPSVRRFSRPRIVLALILGAALIYLLIMGGMLGLRSLRSFVHNQPEYLLNFTEIVLDPPPPAWFRGGSKRFLERARVETGEPKRFSLLDHGSEPLKLAFKRFGWVREATVATASPNRVVVHIDFREPVALVVVKGADSELVDGDGVILDLEDVDQDAVTLLHLDRSNVNWPNGNSPPADRRFGERWKTANGAGGLPEVDEYVLAGAKLADALRGLLTEGRSRRSSSVPLPTILVQLQEGILVQLQERILLWVQFADKGRVCWGPPPGEEKSAESIRSKWKILVDWLAKRKSMPGHAMTNWKFEGGSIVEFFGTSR